MLFTGVDATGIVTVDDGLFEGAGFDAEAEGCLEEAVDTDKVTGSEAMVRAPNLLSMTAGDMARIDKSGAMAR